MTSRKFPEELIEKAQEMVLGIFTTALPTMSDVVSERLEEKLRFVVFMPGEEILSYGQKCRNIYFLYQGVIRSSLFRAGDEKTAWFMTEGDIVVGVHSFYKQIPSIEKLTALKRVLAVSLSWEDFQKLCMDFAEFNTAVRILTELHLMLVLERTEWMNSVTIVERYEGLLQMKPAILKHVPIKELADFFGVRRETISRMRNRYKFKR